MTLTVKDASGANQTVQTIDDLAADGGQATIGTTTDDAYAGSGGSTLVAALKGIFSKLSGSLAVTGTFWQDTQPISASDLPLPAGAATAANQPAINGDGGALAHVTNLPATQAVSAAASSVAAGAAVDGWDLTQGAKADSAYAGSGAASVVAVLKGLYAALVAPTPAGSNVIGGVTIADGGHTTFGAKADAKSTATDTTAVSAISIWKQISASVQALVTNLGTLTFSATRLLVRGEPRAFSVAFTTLTRPANVTAYSANDSISDNATAGSVSALSATPSDTNDDPLLITSLIVDTTDTGLAAGVQIRAFLYNSDPTANSGVGAGDNAAFSNKKAGFIGTMVGTFLPFSDGGKARLVPSEGNFIIAKPSSGGASLWVQYQTLGAFTPSANSTTLIGTLNGEQRRV